MPFPLFLSSGTGFLEVLLRNPYPTPGILMYGTDCAQRKHAQLESNFQRGQHEYTQPSFVHTVQSSLMTGEELCRRSSQSSLVVFTGAEQLEDPKAQHRIPPKQEPRVALFWIIIEGSNKEVVLTCRSVPSPCMSLQNTNRGMRNREMEAMNQPKMLAHSG